MDMTSLYNGMDIPMQSSGYFEGRLDFKVEGGGFFGPKLFGIFSFLPEILTFGNILNDTF